MRRLPLVLVMLLLGAPLRAQDEEESEKVVFRKAGLSIEIPEGWDRDGKREKGGIKFAAILDLTPTKYVLFSIETGPGADWDEARWLAAEKDGATKFLKTVETAWSTEPILVGSERATRFTIGGKANAEKEFDLRVRGCGVVREETFYRITEISYNRAHDDGADALRAMWEAIKFEEGNPFEGGSEDESAGEERGAEGTAGEEGAAGEEAPQGEPLVIEDKVGNFKVSMPPGWSLDRAPVETEDDPFRLAFKRTSKSGDDLAGFEVFRYRINDSQLFVTEEPGDVLLNIVNDRLQFFEPFYEEGSAKVVRPEIDARTGLGGAEKACAYECRGIRMSEEAKKAEAEKLLARGDASVKVPEYPPLVLRGRLAMISPYIYVTRAWFRRNLSDNENLIAEVNRIHDSWEFASTQAKPPQLPVGEQPLGNTLADPANAKERKVSKMHEYKKGTKVMAALKFDYVLPPGFKEVEQVHDVTAKKAWSVGEQVPIVIAAQDENNGWVYIALVAVSAKTLGANESFPDKKEVFGTWVSNFESVARGTGKMPKKPGTVKLGNIDGDGATFEGKIDNFHATEIHMVTDESGWRIEFELKTRGSGAKTFGDGIKTFMKKFKVQKK